MITYCSLSGSVNFQLTATPGSRIIVRPQNADRMGATHDSRAVLRHNNCRPRTRPRGASSRATFEVHSRKRGNAEPFNLDRAPGIATSRNVTFGFSFARHTGIDPCGRGY